MELYSRMNLRTNLARFAGIACGSMDVASPSQPLSGQGPSACHPSFKKATLFGFHVQTVLEQALEHRADMVDVFFQ